MNNGDAENTEKNQPMSEKRVASGEKRKRGGQPGNHNALKHGYYSRSFRAAEMSDLQSIQDGLDSEIKAMRIFTRRMLDLTDGIKDLDTAIRVLGSLGVTSVRLARLLETHKNFTGDGSDVAAALNQALREFHEELKK